MPASKHLTIDLTSGDAGASIRNVIAELKRLPMEQREKPAKALAVVAERGNEEIAAILVREGVISPLVSLLSGFDGGQIHAAQALGHIAAHMRPHRSAIAKAGALAPLVALLRTGSNKAQLAAAHAIAAMSQDAEHHRPIIKAGGLQPLVRLLRSGTADAQVYAASAVAHLANTFERPEEWEESALTGDVETQNALAAAGVIPLLLGMLQTGKTQTAAAECLARLAAFNPEIQMLIAAEGGVAPLLNLLNSTHVPAQVSAAHAIAELARCNGDNQTAVSRAGGIGPLLSMLAATRPQAQATASLALALLASAHPDNQEHVAVLGGLPKLTALLATGPTEVQSMASFALAEICRRHARHPSPLLSGVACTHYTCALAPHTACTHHTAHCTWIRGRPPDSARPPTLT